MTRGDEMKNFIEEQIEDVDQLILDFVKTKEFENLQKILKQKYFGQLQISQSKKDDEWLRNKAMLDVLLGICPDLQMDAERILEERRNTQDTKDL